MWPAAHWAADELVKRALLEQGVAVDRTTPWGNPFELGKDGDRKTVIAAYRDHYLPFKPSLLARLGELRGKALGCWCAPDACHGDVLGAEADGDGVAPAG